MKNINDVFHVSILEPYRTVKRRKSETPLFIDVDDEDQAESEKGLDSKMYYWKLMYLVKWLGYPVTDNEWIAISDMAEVNEYVAEFYSNYLCKPSPENQHREKRS